MRRTSLKEKGITLVALVVTIIVLLILAGITINMAIRNNGIMQRAKDSKTLTEIASVIEQAKTDILGQVVENKGETISETQLKKILGKYFEEFDDELPEDLSETTIKLTAKNEYGGYDNIALADIYKGILKKEDLPAIDYGHKTAQTIAVGDDVTIGKTEKFKVIKKSSDGKRITLIPYYNLKLNVTPIKQATEETAESAGTVSFSSIDTPTWSASCNIDLNVHENNVKSYIDSYQTTLRSFGINNVTAKMGTYYYDSLPTAPEMVGYEAGTSCLVNPSGQGGFWIGSAEEYSGTYVCCWTEEYGIIVTEDYRNSNSIGVRPVVILTVD